MNPTILGVIGPKVSSSGSYVRVYGLTIQGLFYMCKAGREREARLRWRRRQGAGYFEQKGW